MHRNKWTSNGTNRCGYIYMVMVSLAVGGIENKLYTTSMYCRGRMLYAYKALPETNEFRWYVAANSSTSNPKLSAKVDYL